MRVVVAPLGIQAPSVFGYSMNNYAVSAAKYGPGLHYFEIW